MTKLQEFNESAIITAAFRVAFLVFFSISCWFLSSNNSSMMDMKKSVDLLTVRIAVMETSSNGLRELGLAADRAISDRIDAQRSRIDRIEGSVHSLQLREGVPPR